MRNVAHRVLLLATAGLLLSPAALSSAAPVDPSHRTGAEFVSIGDSYIDSGSFAGSIVGPCIQATDSVARLIAAKMPQTSFGDWGCGGAGTADITQVSPMGPQVQGLSAATQFVAVSIGGNDENLFVSLISNCFLAATCTQAVQDQAADALTRLPARLDVAYAAIRQHAPNAEVAVLDYLSILPEDATGCFIDAIAGPTANAFNIRVQKALNDAVAAAAHRAGFTFVDPVSEGDHSICAPVGQRYVSFVGLEPGEGGTFFHPTRLGREYMAAKAFAALAAD
ncbi:GDSL-type esterase/lipase family protein [Nocardia salmonicida]|uniref:GDSL-type esterase/lipase family protein n=1 Tax=Nocardia salmonicida TaxID=53431 RepID=UPI0037BCE54A